MTDLRTFRLPASIDGTRMDVEMGKQMILAWRLDRRFQVELSGPVQRQLRSALQVGRRFFALSAARKSRFTSDLSYSGYFAPGERVVDGQADPAERFTACKDLPVEDPRVQAQWPCHGPVPWPDRGLACDLAGLMGEFGGVSARLLRLLALGLEMLDMDVLVRLTGDGWHHVSLVGTSSGTAGPGERETGCGMLVIAVHRDARLLTVTAGDSLQFLTRSYLSSGDAGAEGGGERPAIVYFHEPNFQATLDPLVPDGGPTSMHYGSHFASTFMRQYPARLTTQRILAENRLAVFGHLSSVRRAA